MEEIFADTSYWLGLSLPSDELHGIASRISDEYLPHARIVISDFVFIEVLNYVSRHKSFVRNELYSVIMELRVDPTVTVVPLSSGLFERGGKRYIRAHDKSWSLTDCTSFLLMEERGIQKALTSDHHFKQAGFNALLTR